MPTDCGHRLLGYNNCAYLNSTPINTHRRIHDYCTLILQLEDEGIEKEMKDYRGIKWIQIFFYYHK